MNTAEKEIADLVAELTEAMITKDADRQAALQARGMVEFSLSPPLKQAVTEGPDPARMRNWFATLAGDRLDYEVTELTVFADGDVAFCHSLNWMAPREFGLWFRATIGLRRIDGAWKIVHMHASTPFYMDGSVRAAVDLKP